MTVPTKSCLYQGEVWHQRVRPKKHSFRYPIFYLMLDLDDLDAAQNKPWCLSFEKFNIFTVYQKDFGGLESGQLKEYLLELLRRAGCLSQPQKIYMLTMPRIFGYAFNPLTVFYCYCENDELSAVIYEVHNTFGERHSYVYPVDRAAVAEGGEIPTFQTDKTFHVSPFFDVTGKYRFHQTLPDEKISLTIHYEGEDEALNFTACLTGRRMALTTANMFDLFMRIPFVTLKVITAIHYEALRLWMKRLRYFRKPAPPRKRYSLNTQNPTHSLSQRHIIGQD